MMNQCYFADSDIKKNIEIIEEQNTQIGEYGRRKAIITGVLAAMILFIDMFFRQSIIGFMSHLYKADRQQVNEFNFLNFGNVGTSIAI